ncbi:MAG: LamG domain-containing protein, partial [Planctomycetes bacterium]|nr:LamG domain-containing protein [Planctomycetota bacterium]
SRIADLGNRYSISLWCWNGMPNDARDTTGWMFSRGRAYGLGPDGDHLGVGGTATEPGKLIFLHGDNSAQAEPVVGRTEIARWTWNHVILVREDDRVRIYLNGDRQPEIEMRSPARFPPGFDRLFFGGRCDDRANWEGRLDEIAVFDRALSAEEIQALSAP